ncbi:MOSC domain-containing protein [Nocardioides panacis]|uniref:MOSC domain-containing protein n=1 Tax=Nocardioides panacis TaxID=2849501 RepID=A0A975SW84_9ACTN|nr:MOSC domain-containing protein [Nocardioides panacis]QWZ06444.1 MOSC domain-containing protein [Nocardioides panacis]
MHADRSPNPVTAPLPPPAPAAQPPRVVAVAASAGHRFSKQTRPVIRLVEGLGVEGDAHLGETVQHRSRVRRDPSQPNLRQVHLIHAELFEEVHGDGPRVLPGDLGENVTTCGVDLLALSAGTLLLLGDTAEVVVTGLRNPCVQIDRFQPGLLARVVGRDAQGRVVRKAGVMAVVRRGGEVRPGDPVTVVPPDGPHRPLEAV